MNKIFKMAPGSGIYYIIRSSEDRSAMIGWNTLTYDIKSGKWFEWLQREFPSYDDCVEILREDQRELRDFRLNNLHRCAQESILTVMAGVEGKSWSFLDVVVEEFRPYERRYVGFLIDEYSEKELEEAEQFVEMWHYDSETRHPHICYSGFLPVYEWEVDPISIPPDPAYAENRP